MDMMPVLIWNDIHCGYESAWFFLWTYYNRGMEKGVSSRVRSVPFSANDVTVIFDKIPPTSIWMKDDKGMPVREFDISFDDFFFSFFSFSFLFSFFFIILPFQAPESRIFRASRVPRGGLGLWPVSDFIIFDSTIGGTRGFSPFQADQTNQTNKQSTVAVGEIANFAAYSFAPAILVTPIGGLSVVIR